MGGDVANTLGGIGGPRRDDLIQHSLCLKCQWLGTSKGDRDGWLLILVIVMGLSISICTSIAVWGADIFLRNVNSNTGLIADLFKRSACSSRHHFTARRLM